jgi:hypothetical protein
MGGREKYNHRTLKGITQGVLAFTRSAPNRVRVPLRSPAGLRDVVTEPKPYEASCAAQVRSQSLAELERNVIRERVGAELEYARQNGTKSGSAIGRPKRIFDCAEVVRLRESALSIEKIARQMNLGVGTVDSGAGCLDRLERRAAATQSAVDRFWPDDIPLADAFRSPLLLGRHRQITDGYQLNLAAAHDGVLATLDRGISPLAKHFPERLESFPAKRQDSARGRGCSPPPHETFPPDGAPSL